jgi:hypothetical protein
MAVFTTSQASCPISVRDSLAPLLSRSLAEVPQALRDCSGNVWTG